MTASRPSSASPSRNPERGRLVPDRRLRRAKEVKEAGEIEGAPPPEEFDATVRHRDGQSSFAGGELPVDHEDVAASAEPENSRISALECERSLENRKAGASRRSDAAFRKGHRNPSLKCILIVTKINADVNKYGYKELKGGLVLMFMGI